MSEIINFGLDISVFNDVIAVGDEKTRSSLAVQLADLVRDAVAPEHEIQQVQPVLMKLTLDPSYQVRRILAEKLVTVDNLDVDVAFSIVADEDGIALPFLSQTRALLATHFIAILRVGDAARARVIAARPDIMPEVIDYIVRGGTVGAALELVENPSAVLGPNDYYTLFMRFSDSDEIVEHLLSKPDLPLEIRILRARSISARMRQLMAEKGWIGPSDAAELCAEAEDNAIMQVLIEADSVKRAAATTYLASKNMLTPAFILRAAATGQMSVVEAVFAHLTGNSEMHIADQLYGASPAQLKSLFRRSGLPQSCYGLLRAACDVVIDMRHEGIELSSVEFGARVLEALMTRYDTLVPAERTRQIEYLGRYGEAKIRKVARQVRADLARAA